MNIELGIDPDESARRGYLVMDFRVQIPKEEMSREALANVDVLAWSAAQAWESYTEPEWSGVRQ